MLLTGGVRKSGDRVRVTVHLVDNATAVVPVVRVHRRERWSTSFAAQESVAERRRQASSSRGCSTPASDAARGGRPRTWRRATSTCRGAIT